MPTQATRRAVMKHVKISVDAFKDMEKKIGPTHRYKAITIGQIWMILFYFVVVVVVVSFNTGEGCC